MQFLDCKITLSFSNQKIKDRSETLINKGIYEVELKFIASLIKLIIRNDGGQSIPPSAVFSGEPTILWAA